MEIQYALVLVLALMSDQTYQTTELAQPVVLAKDYTHDDCKRAAAEWRQTVLYPTQWEVPEEDKRMVYEAKCIPMPSNIPALPSIYLPREKE